MSIPGQEILIEYDDEELNCHVMLNSGKVIGLGATHSDALEDLREAAHFYLDTMIDLKLRDMNRVTPAEGGQ